MQQKYTLILFLWSAFCCSQNSKIHFHSLHIQGQDFNLNTKVIFEDSFGFTWLGTNNGLFKYDGHNLEEFQYNVFDQNSLPNNTVNSIVEDDFKNLWIGTESYLVLFNRKTNSFKGFYKNSLAETIGKSQDGTLWANLGKWGLVKIHTSASVDSIKVDTDVIHASSIGLLPTDKMADVYQEDAFERGWLGTANGIFGLDEKGYLHTTNFNFQTLCIKPYGESSFLVATPDHIFVLAYRKESYGLEILEKYKNITSEGNINFIPNDVSWDFKKNVLWIATNNGLVKGTRVNNKYQFGLFKAGNGNGFLASNNVNTVNLDTFQNLWIGSSKGVNKHLGRTSIFEYYPLLTENRRINTIFQDKNKRLWLGTSNGELIQFSNKQIVASNQIDGFDDIRVIKYDYNREEIYLGVGRAILRSKGFHNNKAPIFKTVKMYDSGVKDIFIFNNNELWVGLWGGGIDVINEETPISSFKKNLIKRLKDAHISVFYLDRNNFLWIGTRGQGLYKIDVVNEKEEHYLPSQKNGLSSDAILCFLETKGMLYIGTRGGGMNVYNAEKNTFKSFEKKDGLSSTTISAMLSGTEGNIWASTHNGISMFDVETRNFVNFNSDDGLKESQFMFNSKVSRSNGNLFFGFSNGFYKVNSSKYKKNDQLARTLITRFEVLGSQKTDEDKLVIKNMLSDFNNAKKSIELPYNENNVRIEFTSLDLTSPNKNEFAYMLEGVNDYWIYTNASNRNANFNGLQPGTYTFMVKSTNSDGVWNENVSMLSFKINPPFWRSNIAVFLYSVLGIALLYTTITLIGRWYRMKKKLVEETISRQKDNEHSRMKMVFFTDISHELRTPLTLIQGTIEKIIKQGQYQLLPQTAKRIHNNSLRMGRLINQIMDIRKYDVGAFKIQVAKSNIVADTLNLKNAFNDFSRMNNIDYNFYCDVDGIKAYYDLQILEKILFNLLSNAFKYTSENGKVDVFLKSVQLNQADAANNKLAPGNYVKCSVRDNGTGIPKENLNFIFDRYYQSTKLPKNQISGTGIGMELVHKLVQSHHGHISVKSEENIFTEFTFLLPVQKKHYEANEFLSKKVPKQPSIITRSEYEVFEEIISEGVHKEDRPSSLKATVLLVEDNYELRDMMKEELSTEFHIIEAKNGLEGYKKALQEKPNLIISDILMPVEDGVSLLKNVKGDENISDIPVFMLTAKGAHEVKMECLKIGASDYIEKPFSPEFVKWKVKNTLGTRKNLKEQYSKLISVNTSEVELVTNDEKLIKKLIKIVEESLENNELSVEFLAVEAGMSRANLYRKLQSIINDTPVNFIKHIRLKRACHLLKKNSMYVSEVAYMTGFSNQKYFSKCFNKEFGMSPTEYAKLFKENSNNQLRSDLVEMIRQVN